MITSLEEGDYQIDWYRNETLVLKWFDIIAKPDSTSNYYVDISPACMTCASDSLLSDVEGFFNFQYRNGHMEDNPAISHLYSVSCGLNTFILDVGDNNKNSIALSFDLNYKYAAFSSDFTMYPPGPLDRERYSAINYRIGLFDRFQFYNSYGEGDLLRGWIFDFGAYYNFPLYFRHKYNDDNMVTSTKKIMK